MTNLLHRHLAGAGKERSPKEIWICLDPFFLGQRKICVVLSPIQFGGALSILQFYNAAICLAYCGFFIRNTLLYLVIISTKAEVLLCLAQ